MTDNSKKLNLDSYQMMMNNDKVKAAIPEIIEHYNLVAQVRKIAYDAYLKQGFTESQALTLALQ